MTKKICEVCKKEIPPMIVMNTDPLTLAEYFTAYEYREEMGKEGKWCLECIEKKRCDKV